MLDFLTSRPGRVAAQAAVLTAVVGGTVAYANAGKAVTISVDGQAHRVKADASTVRALLADEAITVTDRDLVAPGLDSTLEDGEQVVVRFARPLTVSVDGTLRTYWTTELTLNAALQSLGIRAQDARLSVSRSQPLGRSGLGLSVSTPKTVTIASDGSTRSVTTTAPTVSDLLADQQLVLGPLDTLSVPPTVAVADGMVLAVTRIVEKSVTALEPIAAPTTERGTSSLEIGQRRVLTQGRPGVRKVVYDVWLANGRQTKRNVLTSVISAAPVTEVVQVGTRQKPTPVATSSSSSSRTSSSGSSGGSAGGAAGSLNWAALARCESGGNPRAVNPSGYYGLYQFSLSTWRSVGGSGNPIDASPSEQLLRAQILFNKAGAGQWSCGSHLYD